MLHHGGDVSLLWYATPFLIEVGRRPPGQRGGGALGGLGSVGIGPHIGGDCRPACPSLRGTGPRSWLSGSNKAEQTRTAPMDHTAALVSGRGCHGAGVCGRARLGDEGMM